MASGSKSKDKGSQGERELCKILGEIFEGSFIRSAGSGAFIGGKNSFRKQSMSEGQVRNTKADIIPPDFLPRLVVEAKWYKDFRFHQLIQPGPNPQLDTWIEQTIECIDDGDVWMVCFKINLRGWYVAVPDGLSDDFSYNNYCVYTGKHGKFKVTDMKEFMTNNAHIIKQLAA